MHARSTSPLQDAIAQRTSQSPDLCYQCGKCSAGCPVREHAEDPPNRVVRFVQLGLEDRALRSKTPWLCAGCMTCSSRCPQRFELHRFMDAVRQIAMERGVAPADPDVERFHRAFLAQVKRNGRSYELGLLLHYKFLSGHLIQDALLAPGMFLRRKMKLLPHRAGTAPLLRRLFSHNSRNTE